MREAIPALAENGPNTRRRSVQELGAFEVARPERGDPCRAPGLDAVHKE